LFQWHKGIKTKSPRYTGANIFQIRSNFILVPSHQKPSTYDALYFYGWQVLYDHLQIACACGIREPFYGVYDEAGMYVSYLLIFTLLEINPGEAGSCLDFRGSPYPWIS